MIVRTVGVVNFMSLVTQPTVHFSESSTCSVQEDGVHVGFLARRFKVERKVRENPTGQNRSWTVPFSHSQKMMSKLISYDAPFSFVSKNA